MILITLSFLLLLIGSGPVGAMNLADEEIRQPLYAESWRLKFGSNDDIGTGAAEDIWTAGGDCQWPTIATTTVIVSDSADDAADGTGCRTVDVQCLNNDLALVPQTVTLNGTTPVALSTDCRRTTRAKCVTAGSGGTNAGTIDIKHGATIIGQLVAGYGQTLIACDTVPDGQFARLAKWGCSVTKTTTGVMQVSIDSRAENGAWQVKETAELRTSASGIYQREFSGWQRFPEHSDIRIRARSASANSMGASCFFDMLLIDNE